ncbi:MAG: VanZ family protein, partial [Kiloniellales bacterium]
LRHSASEALHFIEYGVLGFLLFGALSHRTRDWGIYLAAALLGAIIGTIDEAIQWLTPRRYWALADIRLNVTAVLLVQGAIALGLKPKIIAPGLSAGSLRLACQLGVVALLLLGASALNTPQRIAWYSSRLPALAFLQENDGVMLEYGHLYEDPEIGVFRSRLAPEALQRSDRERAEEGGNILAQFRDEARYGEFLELYTPVSDPFLHEARVHLFRRDRYIERAEEARADEATFRENMTIAFRENRIMEKYFPGALAASGYAWPPEMRARVEEQARADAFYDSWVSRALVTSVGEREVVWFFAIAIAGLSAIAWALGPKRGRRRVPG